MILLIFVVGYALTFDRFGMLQGRYALYSILSLLACALLLSKLKKFDAEYIAIWLTFVVLVATQYVRFYWLVLDPSFLKNMLTPMGWNALTDVNAQIAGFELLTISFCVICISIFLYIHFWKDALSRADVQDASDEFYRSVAYILLTLSIVLLVFLGYFALKYHIGQMGYVASEPLPYRLAGIIHYGRLVALPGTMLLFIVVAHRAKRQDLVRVGLMLVLIHGAVDVLVRSSRGAILFALISLVFLTAVKGFKLLRFEKITIVVIGIVGLFFIPLTHQYRVFHLSGLDVPASLLALNDMHWNISQIFVDAINFAYFRLPGIEMPIAIIGDGGQPLGDKAFSVLATPNGLADYLTYAVLKFPEGSPQSFAPSFLGWFYLMGGVYAVIMGSVVISVVVTVLWKKLAQLPLFTLPVAQTFFLLLLFAILTEGTLDTLRYQALVMIVSVIGLEMLYRISARLIK
ncbi:MAG: hypothetical protein AABY83_05845 [Pseudomonadota bacterium]